MIYRRPVIDYLKSLPAKSGALLLYNNLTNNAVAKGDIDAVALWKEAIETATGQILVPDNLSKPVGLKPTDYIDILTTLSMIRADQGLHVTPTNIPKLKTILEKEYPEYKDTTPKPYLIVMNDVIRYQDKSTGTLLDVISQIEKPVIDSQSFVRKDVINPIEAKLSQVVNVLDYLTNPYIITGIVAGLLFIRFKR
jgi:hypothetical protein